MRVQQNASIEALRRLDYPGIRPLRRHRDEAVVVRQLDRVLGSNCDCSTMTLSHHLQAVIDHLRLQKRPRSVVNQYDIGGCRLQSVKHRRLTGSTSCHDTARFSTGKGFKDLFFPFSCHKNHFVHQRMCSKHIQAVADQRLPQRFHVDLIFIRAEAGSAASGEKNCRNSSAQISFSGCHITCRTRQRSD